MNRLARTTLSVAVLSLVLACGGGFKSAWAADDQQRIPLGVLADEVPAPEAPARSQAVFVEANAEQVARRALAVPIPSPDRRRDVLRLLVDARADWALGEGLSAKLSARLDVFETRDDGRHRDEEFSLREASLQWRASGEDVAEVGRVNLRHGVALGFNPTDFFKARTTVDTSTRDPQVQRVNRLGTMMLNLQRVNADSSVLIAFAPRLTQTSSLVEHEPQQRLRLGDTNGENRLLLKGQLPLFGDLRPELLAFRDRHGWRVGVNLTQAFGQQVTGFLEYAGGRRKPLLRRTLENGVTDGDLPPATLSALPDVPERWLNDLAVGGTWTGSNRLSLSAEFAYHQGGLTREDWQRWFSLGTSGADGTRLAWYLRGAANARLDPLFRRNIFLRAQWDQVGHRDLSFSAFVNRNLDDDSQLVQIALELRATPATRLRAMSLFTRGRADSQFGSDPARRAVLLSVLHYF